MLCKFARLALNCAGGERYFFSQSSIMRLCYEILEPHNAAVLYLHFHGMSHRTVWWIVTNVWKSLLPLFSLQQFSQIRSSMLATHYGLTLRTIVICELLKADTDL